MKRLHIGAVLAAVIGLAMPWAVGARTAQDTGQTPFAMAGGRGVSLPVAETAAAADRAAAFIDLHGAAYGLDRSQIKFTRASKRDEVGLEHVRYQQVYQGIPVAGAEFIVHLKGSRAMAANGRVLDRFPDEMEPAVATATARSVAREVIGKYRASDATGALYSAPVLQIFNRSFIEQKGTMPSRLAWFVEATGPSLREFIWIDARTGALLLHFSQLAGAKQREIYNANGGPTLPGTLIRAEGQPPIGNADIDDAYDLAGVTYDYFFNTFGRDGLNGAGGTMALTVSWNGGAGTCPTSFWSGSIAVFCLGFTAADDIVAHELTHGLIQSEANLFAYVQSGALMESYSDIFGETIDLGNVTGADTPGVRWRIGEDLSVGALRDMMDPTAFQDPGKMSDVQYFACDTTVDNGGVHTNSGPPNHAFALMVDGGIYNGYEITGIGLAKAARIQYRALTTYLTMASAFADNFNAVDQACSDLVGTNGMTAPDCAQVHQAQLAVEMNSRWSCQDPLVPIQPTLCPAGGTASFVFTDGFEGVSPPWTFNSTTATEWSVQSSQAAEGARAAFGPNPGSVSDHQISMASGVVLPAGARAIFTHAPNLEPVFDGGVVEYSADNGATWIDAVQFADGGLQTDTICPDCGSPLADRHAWSKASFGYQRSRLNLASLAGQNVRLRFRIGTDASVSAPGWTIDNVGIYSCVTTAGAPVINTGPAAQTVGAGGVATFSVAASGNATLRYQWLKDGSAIPGATASSLVIANVQLSHFGHYSVIVSNDQGTATSDGAALFVAIGGPPSITEQPSHASVTVGQTARFAADAINATSFQWQVSTDGGGLWTPVPNSAPYSGATARVLTITGATAPLNGNLYRLIASNGSGNAQSQFGRLGVLPPSFVANGTFGTGDTSGWSVFESPAGSSESRINAGVFEWNRLGNSSTQATIFQNTGVAVSGTPLEATFDLGNSANIRQRVSVLMIDADFSDITVCTFWLDPAAPMRQYRMRTHTTKPWANAAIYFYAATTASFAANGGYLRLDNVAFNFNSTGSDTRTDCVDPTSPPPPGGAESASLVLNGDFSQGMAFWQNFGTITGGVVNGAFRFIRTPGLPAGVVFQATGGAVAPNEFLTARLDLGNSSPVRKRVTVLVHANDFSDLAACTFFLPPGLALSPYEVRMRATKAWAAGASTGATLSIYGATVGPDQWIELDNASLTRTPGTAIQGTECIEPVEVLGSLMASSSTRASAPPASTSMAAQSNASTSRTSSRGASPRTVDLKGSAVAAGRTTSWMADASAPVEIQASRDGVEWLTVARVAPGEDWTEVEVDLGAFDEFDRVPVRLRVVYAPPALASSAWRVISLRIVR